MLLTVGLVILFLINLSLGSVQIPIKEIFNILIGLDSEKEVWNQIIWDFRMTKAFTCILSGAALTVAGLQMQTLFRNPLAGPDVLGLTSGASLAVSLVFMSGGFALSLFNINTAWTVAIAASVGSTSVFLIMFIFSKRLTDSVSLLIVGLMVGAGTASIVSVLQYISSAEELQTYMIWTFGSLGALNWSEIKVLTLVTIIGIAAAVTNLKSLNVWLLGDRYAQNLGVNVKRTRLLSILSASILTGGVTAFCGPIAFVGLAVPHLMKLLIKTFDHKALIPAVVLGGATLLLFCDIIAQLPASNRILPINAVTALIGAPVVIWVIMKNKIIR